MRFVVVAGKRIRFSLLIQVQQRRMKCRTLLMKKKRRIQSYFKPVENLLKEQMELFRHINHRQGPFYCPTVATSGDFILIDKAH